MRLASGIVALTALGSVATASPLEDGTLGGAVFTGPTEPHASSMLINPAAMELAGAGAHIFVGGSLALDQVTIDRDLADPSTGALRGGPTIHDLTLSPGGLVAAYAQVQDWIHLGASLSTPFAERFMAGQDAARYHVRGGHLYTYLFDAAASFKTGDRVMIGFAVSLGYTSLRFDFDRDTALEAGSNATRGIASACGGAPCGFENPAAAEHIDLSTATEGGFGVLSTDNLGLSVGLAVQVVEDWWATLSYVGPPGVIKTLDPSGSAHVTTASRDGSAHLVGNAEISVRMPQSVWLGLRGPIAADWDLVTGLRWEDLSRHDQLDLRMFGGQLTGSDVPEWIPRYRGLRDVWQLAAGLEQREGPALRLGGRVRLENGAVTAARISPLQVDGSNVALSLGAELRLAQHFVVVAGYDGTWFPAVRSTHSAFDPQGALDCVDSGYAFDRCQAAREGRAIPTADGDYRRLRHALIFSLRWDSL